MNQGGTKPIFVTGLGFSGASALIDHLRDCGLDVYPKEFKFYSLFLVPFAKQRRLRVIYNLFRYSSLVRLCLDGEKSTLIHKFIPLGRRPTDRNISLREYLYAFAFFYSGRREWLKTFERFFGGKVLDNGVKANRDHLQVFLTIRDAVLLVVVRDPADQLYDIMHHRRLGQTELGPVLQGFDETYDRLFGNLRVVPPRRLRVVSFEALVVDEDMRARLRRYLGVEKGEARNFKPATSRKNIGLGAATFVADSATTQALGEIRAKRDRLLEEYGSV